MRCISIICTGSYGSWTQWAVASIYNSVDQVICVNSGWDFNDISKGDCVPLERDLQQLKEIDVDNKIVQVKADWSKVKYVDPKNCEGGRARNIAYGMQLAYKYGADWVYKQDADQICDESFTREALENLANNCHDGYRFAEYADFFRVYDRVQSFPNRWTDDGSLFFQSNPKATSIGQGSPVHHREQFEIYDMKTFHMRHICPPDMEEWDYFYNRFLYHTWSPNLINELGQNKELGRQLTFEECQEIAQRRTESILKSEGHNREYFIRKEDPDIAKFPPGKPLVVKLGPKTYIEEGHPK